MSIALTLVLVLAIVGTLREVMVLRGEVTSLRQLIIRPPGPSFVRGFLPAGLKQALRVPRHSTSSTNGIAIFVSEGCGGCSAALDQLDALQRDDLVERGRIAVVVAAKSVDSELFRLAGRVSDTVMLDDEGEIFREAEIRATPTFIALELQTARAVDFRVGLDVAWVCAHAGGPVNAGPPLGPLLRGNP